jgi:hypothetical protein
MSASTKCYQCGNDNPEQAFCGACGSPLALNAYISTKVREQLADSIRDRDVLEMDSSIKVFKQAWGWIRLIIGIAAALLILAGGGVIWKASDFWSGVNNAKQSVADTAKKSSDDITRVSSQSKDGLSKALEAGKTTITTAANDAARQSQAMKKSTIQSKAEISKETASFRSDLERSRQQLQAASKMQPEIESLRKQLGEASKDIEAQRRVLSSSQDFAKSIFSSHVTQTFLIGEPPRGRYVMVPPPTKEFTNTVVWLLLDSTPIKGTLQLQYFVSLQPPNSYFQFAHNLVVFLWGDPAENLQQKPLSVSYFPDRSDNIGLIHSLSEHDGRVWADDQPLPKINQPDPEFTGNRWIIVPPPKP